MMAGKMNKRVTIQQRTSSVDATYGQQLLTWTDVATVWAAIDTPTGSQVFKSQSVYSQLTHVVTVRWQLLYQDIKSAAAYRLKYVSAGVTRYFDIGAALNAEERNASVMLLCSEGLNDGQ